MIRFVRPLVLLALVSPLAAAPVRAAESYDACIGYVDSLPAVINTQGVWCLRADLATSITSGNAITLNANNVTLDCNGFKIGGLAGGPLSVAKGIYGGRINGRVRNCHVRGFDTGINMESERALVEDNTVEGALRTGIRTVGDGNRVLRNRILDTGGVPGQISAIGTPTGSLEIRDNLIDGVISVDGAAVALNIAADLVMTGNVIRGLVPGGAGSSLPLMLHQHTGDLRGNTIYNTGTHNQFYCSGSDTVVRDNVFFGGQASLPLCSNESGNYFR